MALIRYKDSQGVWHIVASAQGEKGAKIIGAEFNGVDIDFELNDGEIVKLLDAKNELKGDQDIVDAAEAARDAAEGYLEQFNLGDNGKFDAKIEVPYKVRPSFAWTDDDALSPLYTHLYPLAQSLNFSVTAAVVPTNIGGAVYCSEANLQEMYASGLIRYGCHTLNHVNLGLANAETAETEIGGGKSAIESFGVPVDVMIYPYGDRNDDVIGVTKKYFPFGLTSGGSPTTDRRINYCPIDTYRLKRFGVDSGSDINDIKTRIDETIDTNGFMVFLSHVGAGGTTSGQLEMYQAVIEYIRTCGYDIEPLMTVLGRFNNRLEIGKWSSESPSDYIVIGANGDTRGTALGAFVRANSDQYTGDSLPSDYAPERVTVNHVNASVAASTSLPGARAGILSAYCFGKREVWYRTYKLASPSAMYMQRAAGADGWDVWEDVNVNIVVRGSQDSETTPVNCPAGKIAYSQISTTEGANFPDGSSGGMLITDRTPTISANARQEWRPFANNIIYTRKASGSNTWGAWYKIEPIAVV